MEYNLEYALYCIYILQLFIIQSNFVAFHYLEYGGMRPITKYKGNFNFSYKTFYTHINLFGLLTAIIVFIHIFYFIQTAQKPTFLIILSFKAENLDEANEKQIQFSIKSNYRFIIAIALIPMILWSLFAITRIMESLFLEQKETISLPLGLLMVYFARSFEDFFTFAVSTPFFKSNNPNLIIQNIYQKVEEILFTKRSIFWISIFLFLCILHFIHKKIQNSFIKKSIQKKASIVHPPNGLLWDYVTGPLHFLEILLYLCFYFICGEATYLMWFLYCYIILKNILQADQDYQIYSMLNPKRCLAQKKKIIPYIY